MSILSPKQEETAEVIYKLTQRFRYPPTLDEIAAEMGITKGTLQYHMTALKRKNTVTWNIGAARSVRIIDQDLLTELRNKYPSNETDTYMNSYADSISAKTGLRVHNEFEVQESRASIPILGKIAAGQPLNVMQNPDEVLELDSFFPSGCYALRVKGESMIDALISDGDLVLIEPRKQAVNGEIVVALLGGESATLKRFYKEQDGRIRLQPENPTMTPIYVSPSEKLDIQGVVKGVIRKT